MIVTSLLLTLALSRQGDPQAILDDAQAKLAKAKTATGAVVFPAPPNGGTPLRMEFRFSKPNLFVTILGDRESWCDGKTLSVLDDKTHDYDQYPTAPDSVPRFAWGFDGFFVLPAGASTLDHPVAGTFASKPAILADFHSGGLRTTVHVAIDPDTHLPAGFVLGVGDQAREYRYEGITLDASLTKGFNWQPTPEWQKRVPMGDKLLKVGTKAPDFTLMTPGGKPIKLSQALAGKKGLLLNFWFVDCAPCRKEFPQLQAMFPSLKSQGFGYLSVNQGDKSDKVNKFVETNGYTFPIALNGDGDTDVVTRYGVPAFPTNLVIDPSGTIVARFVGFDEEGLKAAIRKLGVKLD